MPPLKARGCDYCGKIRYFDPDMTEDEIDEAWRARYGHVEVTQHQDGETEHTRWCYRCSLFIVQEGAQ